MIEACVGVVSACLPTLRPLVSEKPFESVTRAIQGRMPFSPSPTKSSRTSASCRESINRDPPSPAFLVPMTELQSTSTYDLSTEMYAKDPELQEGDLVVHQDISRHVDVV